MTKANSLLGKFELRGIPPTPRGHFSNLSHFDIDANDILNAPSGSKSTGKENKDTTMKDNNCLNKEDIECMTQEAEKFKVRYEKQRDKVLLKNSMESYAFSTRDQELKMRRFQANQ